MQFPKIKEDKRESIHNIDGEIIGKGISRIVIKIPSEIVKDKEGYWNSPRGYCVKIAEDDNGFDQNKKEVELYHRKDLGNKQQLILPPFDWSDDYSWVLYPIANTKVSNEDYRKFKQKCAEMNILQIVRDITPENIGKYKGTMYIIDSGGGMRISKI